MKKVVVTGGTGFIGSWLVKEMLDNSVGVIMLVRDIEKCKYRTDNQVEVIQYDSVEYEELKKKE